MMERFQSLIAQSARTRPAAQASIKGDAGHPRLHGTVRFYPYRSGVVVCAELWGLPYDDAPCAPNIYALHIHATGDCTGNGDMAFANAGGHYNPQNCPHPAHAGDLPPLFGNKGFAWQCFYTERFMPGDVIGKAVIVHERRDDFSTQPAGDAGSRIGCGVIRTYR